MFFYIIKRIILGILAVLSVSSLVCVIVYFAPVDPARMSFGQRSDEETVHAFKKKYFLDKGIGLQVFHYFEDLSPIQWVSLNDNRLEDYEYKIIHKSYSHQLIVKYPYFRKSYTNGKDVWDLVTEALPGTIILAFTSMFIAIFFGLSLGWWCALQNQKLADKIILAICTFLYAIPSYISAILCAVIFAFFLGPLTGLSIQGSLWEFNDFGEVGLHLKNLILPTLALGIRPISMICQMSRASILDVMESDYVRTARAKGLSQWGYLTKHILPNSINPILTTISSWFASLLTGAFFVEYVFNYKGLGMLTITAINQFDIPVVIGCCIITVIIFVFVNIITDILYGFFDPRISNN
jgi:peptide/nickel transport system permease protein